MCLTMSYLNTVTFHLIDIVDKFLPRTTELSLNKIVIQRNLVIILHNIRNLSLIGSNR